MAKCPFRSPQFSEMYSCYLGCVLYEQGSCLIAEALKTYIKVNSPITAYNEDSEGRIKTNLFDKYPPRRSVEEHSDEYYDSWAGPVGYD